MCCLHSDIYKWLDAHSSKIGTKNRRPSCLLVCDLKITFTDLILVGRGRSHINDVLKEERMQNPLRWTTLQGLGG